MERGRDGHDYASMALVFALNGCTRIDDITTIDTRRNQRPSSRQGCGCDCWTREPCASVRNGRCRTGEGKRGDLGVGVDSSVGLISILTIFSTIILVHKILFFLYASSIACILSYIG